MALLALVANQSESYLGKMKDSIIKKWGKDDNPITTVDRFSKIPESDLFGDIHVSIILAKELDDFKKLTEEALRMDRDGKLDEKLEGGVIVLTTVNKQSTGKMEKLVLSKGGEVHSEKKADYKTIAPSMINKLSISKELKNFLIDFSGEDDFSRIIGVVRNIESLPKKAQSSLTLEDIYVRLPKQPGAIPPWDIEKNIHSNNPVEAIRVYRRYASQGSPFAAAALLKNSFMKSYRVSMLPSNVNLSEIGLKGYPATLAKQRAKKYGKDKLNKVMITLVDLEENLKGGSPIESDLLFEKGILEICSLLNS